MQNLFGLRQKISGVVPVTDAKQKELEQTNNIGSEIEPLSEEDKLKINQSIKLTTTEELDSQEKTNAADSESDCENCTNHDDDHDEKVFNNLQIDKESTLFNSSKTPSIQLIVPTSQTDWKFDACMEFENSVQYKLNTWAMEQNRNNANININCNVTSLPINIMDIEIMRHQKNRILILPHFIWINDLTVDKVTDTMDTLLPFLLDHSKESKAKLLSQFDFLSEANEKAFVFICSHKTRDKRCGITAPILKKRFDTLLMKHGLYRDYSDIRHDGIQVAFINHVGGHKFAANVLIYLKSSNTLVWLGRITPNNVKYIVNGLLLNEHSPELAFPEKIRCIKKYNTDW
ncbi:hypothetical protein TBLA_0F01190 [Henningerozyma blattae CBS 6284]|uniref:Actin patches distal protein 1 n=1 Tax=Henningerozyma blattae (strain ATCC 34711 / CBS 6284 / DSM 70876 / NBRC 10599 / NRRL Y-10934 / UCD 77-7) TaxID=1071380 RepID=I2H5L0_HENB6|nr:hypothetical protein TBLA_0F01190 [Tetrapisispora blattae CBS 6284]CCH61662.1 hypothetical protein TBLA_0F01190 [Tetrapisispora blattae CBS 6284]